jgi:hypothetical protein
MAYGEKGEQRVDGFDLTIFMPICAVIGALVAPVGMVAAVLSERGIMNLLGESTSEIGPVGEYIQSNFLEIEIGAAAIGAWLGWYLRSTDNRGSPS